VYLFQKMDGKEQGTAGHGGVLEPVKFEHYAAALAPSMELVFRGSAFRGASYYHRALRGYEDAVWKRR
jgi:hypothetical protein